MRHANIDECVGVMRAESERLKQELAAARAIIRKLYAPGAGDVMTPDEMEMLKQIAAKAVGGEK